MTFTKKFRFYLLFFVEPVPGFLVSYVGLSWVDVVLERTEPSRPLEYCRLKDVLHKLYL